MVYYKLHSTTKIVLATIVLLYFSMAGALAQGVKYGATIKCFAVSGNTIYAGTMDGLFLSKNYGSNWAKVNLDTKENGVMQIAISGKNVFVASAKGLFSSFDNGKNWKINNWFVTNGQSSQISAVTVNNNEIFVASLYGKDGVFTSTDNGNSWKEKNNGLSNKNIIKLVTTQKGVYALTCTSSGNNPDGVFFLPNNGDNWEKILTEFCISDFSEDETNTYVGTNSAGVLKKIGSEWIKVNGLLSGMFHILIKGSRIYVGTQGYGLYSSTDRGNNWKEINNGLKNRCIEAIAVIGSNLFVGTRTGVFLSTNNGNSWQQVNTG